MKEALSPIVGMAAILALMSLGCETDPEPPDHFRIYEVERVEANIEVGLEDQFDPASKPARLDAITHFANPVHKKHAGGLVEIGDKNAHLTWYRLIQERPEPRRTIRFLNQFGQHSVDIRNPTYLLVPTEKTSDDSSAFPERLDHYKCYEIVRVNTVPALPLVALEDQFLSTDNVQIGTPRHFCTPVSKQHAGAEAGALVNEFHHLAIYDTPPEPIESPITTRDQFGEHELFARLGVMLAVPTEKQVVVPHEDG